MSEFRKDLAAARPAELFVMNTLAALTDEWDFQHVGEDRLYYKIGDIKAINKKSGEIAYIEVKNDSRIADTGNVLCEEENYFFDCRAYSKGNMYSDYQYYCVLSQSERKIYVIDFDTLRRIYKFGRYATIYHYDNICYCYLLPLEQIKKQGGLLYEVSY